MMKCMSRGLMIVGLVSLCGSANAGWPLHGLGHRSSGCNCGHSAAAVPVVVQPAPVVVHAAPVADCGCECAAAVQSCCGIAGGISHLGNVYGLGVHAGHADVAVGGFGVGGHGGYGVSSGSGLTGYEGLPNMDGGGINHRYPYHSYRRPWAHPGPPSTNVSIVW